MVDCVRLIHLWVLWQHEKKGCGYHLPLPKTEMIIIDMVNFDMSYGFFGVSLNLQHKQTNLFIWNVGIGSKSLKILVALRVRWQTPNVLLEFDANFATKLKEKVIRESFPKKKKKKLVGFWGYRVLAFLTKISIFINIAGIIG